MKLTWYAADKKTWYSEGEQFCVEKYSTPIDGDTYFCYRREEKGRQKFNFMCAKPTLDEARSHCESNA